MRLVVRLHYRRVDAVMSNYVVFGLLLLTFLGGCQRGNTEALSTKNEVTIGAVDVMITINPLLTTDQASRDIQLEVWQSLNQIDPATLLLKPVLASLPTLSADRRTLSYAMDSRARWSDGVAVTPADVIYTFKSLLNPLCRTDAWKGNFSGLDSVWSPAPNMVSFHYNGLKFNRDYDIATILILPKHSLDGGNMTDRISWAELHDAVQTQTIGVAAQAFNGLETSQALSRFVGSGPYVFEQWDRGQLVSLRKSGYYWANAIPGLEAYPDRLIYRKIGDNNARIVALKSRDIDVAEISSEDYLHSFVDGRWSFIKRDTVYDVNYSSILWNNSRPLFASKNVRKALTMLVNRDTMLQIIYHGLAKKAEGPVNPLQPGWNPSVHQPTYNPQIAKHLLAEDGWVDNKGDGTLSKIIGGKRIPFEFTIQATAKTPITLLFIEELRKIGINAWLMILDFPTVLENVRSGSYDAYFGAEGNDPIEPALSSDFHTRANTNGSTNKCRYSNPVADSLMEAIETEPDRDTRLGMEGVLQRIIVGDQPETYLFSVPSKFAWIDRFDGVRLSAVEPVIDPRYFRVRSGS